MCGIIHLTKLCIIIYWYSWYSKCISHKYSITNKDIFQHAHKYAHAENTGLSKFTNKFFFQKQSTISHAVGLRHTNTDNHTLINVSHIRYCTNYAMIETNTRYKTVNIYRKFNSPYWNILNKSAVIHWLDWSFSLECHNIFHRKCYKMIVR